MFIGNLPLLAWGIFFIAAAAGDIWMTWLLTKENPKSINVVAGYGKFHVIPFSCLYAAGAHCR